MGLYCITSKHLQGCSCIVRCVVPAKGITTDLNICKHKVDGTPDVWVLWAYYLKLTAPGSWWQHSEVCAGEGAAQYSCEYLQSWWRMCWSTSPLRLPIPSWRHLHSEEAAHHSCKYMQTQSYRWFWWCMSPVSLPIPSWRELLSVGKDIKCIQGCDLWQQVYMQRIN